MSNMAEKQGVWFVYDGDCPMCNTAANAFRIKQQYGSLHLVNARETKNDPLIEEINRRKLDLDEGMVIYCQDRFYHGKDALKFMARYGDTNGVLNYFNKIMFWTSAQAKLFYPWLRGTRNLLLRLRKINKIDNLNKKNEPIFKSIFGEAWDGLPPVIKKHYANRPYTDDLVTVEGTLDVFCAGPIKALWRLFVLMKNIPPFSEKNVPVTVNFRSDKDTQRFHFHRAFHFKDRKPYDFRSYMIQIKDNEVMEVTGMGMGWRAYYGWKNGKVVMKHSGYSLKFMGYYIPMPLHLLIGEGYAEEIPVDDDTFDMCMHLTHPKWGKIYEYKGRFKVTKET